MRSKFENWVWSPSKKFYKELSIPQLREPNKKCNNNKILSYEFFKKSRGKGARQWDCDLILLSQTFLLIFPVFLYSFSLARSFLMMHDARREMDLEKLYALLFVIVLRVFILKCWRVPNCFTLNVVYKKIWYDIRTAMHENMEVSSILYG